MTTRPDAYEVIRRDALAGVERRRLQPDRQLGDVRAEIERAVEEYQRRARMGAELALGDPRTMVQRVLRSITELGPLSELLARRDVEEIFVEGPRVTFLDIEGRLRGLAEPTTEEENRQILDRLLAATERQLNAKHPIAGACIDGTALDRRHPTDRRPARQRSGATRARRHAGRAGRLRCLTEQAAVSGRQCSCGAASRCRGAGAGKTTLAAALPQPGVALCEELRRIREVSVPPCTAGTTVRPPGLDGTGEISCAIWSSSSWRCVRTGSSSARCGAPRRSS